MRRAVFLDRDGVINEVVMRDGKPASPRSLEEFRLAPGIAEAVSEMRGLGFLTIVVTNQPDVARGITAPKVLERMHERIREELSVDEIRACPHDDANGCNCRKPKSGMFIDAARDWEIDIGRSFLIADGWKDIEAGRKAGCTTILLDASYNEDAKPDHRVKDLNEAMEIIRRSEDS